jgi:DNA-binding transcriptional ArsR family regulator
VPNTTDYAKALTHPLRVEILARLDIAAKSNGKHDGERPGAYSPSELTALVGAPLGNVSYHVRELAKAGLIKPAGRPAQRRGALEHFYRSVVSPEDLVALATADIAELRSRIAAEGQT